MCWCLSENIAKQQQLAAPSPESKVRASLVVTALAAWLPLGQPAPLSLRIELGTSPGLGLGSGQQALGKEACARTTLPLGVSLDLLSEFDGAQVERQSQIEHDPSILGSVLQFANGKV